MTAGTLIRLIPPLGIALSYHVKDTAVIEFLLFPPGGAQEERALIFLDVRWTIKIGPKDVCQLSVFHTLCDRFIGPLLVDVTKHWTQVWIQLFPQFELPFSQAVEILRVSRVANLMHDNVL